MRFATHAINPSDVEPDSDDANPACADGVHGVNDQQIARDPKVDEIAVTSNLPFTAAVQN